MTPFGAEIDRTIRVMAAEHGLFQALTFSDLPHGAARSQDHILGAGNFEDYGARLSIGVTRSTLYAPYNKELEDAPFHASTNPFGPCTLSLRDRLRRPRECPPYGNVNVASGSARGTIIRARPHVQPCRGG